MQQMEWDYYLSAEEDKYINNMKENMQSNYQPPIPTYGLPIFWQIC